jgi:Ca2+-binding EF-hand superfamily protein
MSATTVLKKVKEQARARNLTQSAIAKIFREVDTNHSGVLGTSEDKDEFEKLLRAMGLKLPAREKKVFIRALDPDDGGQVSLANILTVFAPEVSKDRLKAIEDAFKSISPNGQEVMRNVLRDRLCGPEFTVVGGRRMRTEQFLDDLFGMFDANSDGTLSKFEFILYYRNLSQAFESDAEFKAIVQASWAF